MSIDRTPEALLRIFDNEIWTERTNGPGMCVQHISDVGEVRLADETIPVGYQHQKRTHPDGLIVGSGRTTTGALHITYPTHFV